MSIETTRPPFSIRCTTFWGWTILIFLVFSFFNYREPIPLSPSVLIIFCITSIALAVPGVLQVIKLRSNKESKITTFLSSLVGGLGLIVLLELKRRGIFVWNKSYVTVPIILFAFLTYAGCYVAESKHFVRIYFALDGFHYVRA